MGQIPGQLGNRSGDIQSGWRLWLVVSVLAMFFVVLIYRIVDLCVLDHDFLQSQSDARTVRVEKIDAHRGMIVDRHGEPLAVSSPVETLWFNPRKIRVSSAQLKAAAKLLEVSPAWLQEKLVPDASREFAYLKRKVKPSIARDVLALNIPGLDSRKEYQRFYPAGEVAAHVVGFTNIDDMGQEGIELAYDDWLSGEPGAKRVLKDLRGRVIKDLAQVKDAEPGSMLELSLDMRVQYLAYRELKAVVEAHRARAGSLVMLDVETGEVLAMVNQPSFNPNNRRSIRVEALRNRAVTDLFEPGSTVKPFTIAAALESGRYRASSRVDTSPGFLRLNGKAIRDARNYGVLDLTHVITKSSNVATSKIALDLSGETMWDMFYRLGFGQPSGVGFPGEGIGRLPSPVRWRPLEVATLSYGYGLNASALQLAQSYSVLANGGYRRSTSLLKLAESPAGEPVLPASITTQVSHMLQQVVEEGGTGTLAKVASYDVAGKTGTVHLVGSNGYEDSLYKAIFAGFAPVENPRIAAVVVVDGPSGEQYYGGEVAAPVFSRVVAETLRLLNVPPSEISVLANRLPEVEVPVPAGRG